MSGRGPMRGGGVVRLASEPETAARTADLVARMLTTAQRAGRRASVVLTGGRMSRQVHAALATVPGGGDGGAGPDWTAVEVWWGDERFVPAADGQRNAGQAREDLLDRVPVDPLLVHEMPAADGDQPEVRVAASAYGDDLRRAVEGHGPGEPWFEVLMLGIGPDGHCASLFPGRPEVSAAEYVVAVQEAPKPPPTRISLGMPALRRARHVVFVATGADKAAAVARSVAGDDVTRTPAAGPRGVESTTWVVDEAAAADLG